MGKSNGKSGHGRQLNLWDQLVPDAGPGIKAAMHEAMKACPLSREQIADEMNRLACMGGVKCNGKGQRVTLALLDKWVAPSAEAHIIPLKWLPIFCRVVGSNLPIEVFARSFAGIRIILEDDYQVLQWAKAEIQSRQARKLARRRSQELGIE